MLNYVISRIANKKNLDCENNKMDNKENLVCNWMLGHSDDSFESIRLWES